MTSSRPYLLRAVYEWIIDNGMTPQIMVDATVKEAEIPRTYVENDKIALNIHPSAVRDLDLGNQSLSFNARFAGKPFHVLVPIRAVMAIYARENGKGLVFSQEADEMDSQQSPVKPAGPHLTIVK